MHKSWKIIVILHYTYLNKGRLYMLGVLKKMFDPNKRQVNRLEKIADQVDALGPEMAKLSDD
jgi:hypothetical protein